MRTRSKAPTTRTDLPSGSVVDVRLDNGTTWRTTTRSDPWQLGHDAWVVLLVGRTGGYDLSRVTEVKP